MNILSYLHIIARLDAMGGGEDIIIGKDGSSTNETASAPEWDLVRKLSGSGPGAAHNTGLEIRIVLLTLCQDSANAQEKEKCPED